MGETFFIASCIFTSKFPELSLKIQEYVKEKHGAKIVRCCTPKYKIKEFEDAMSGKCADVWKSLPDSATFTEGDVVYSLCHNCTNIIINK